LLPGITVQLFIHKHTDPKVTARAGAYRQGDVVAVYDGIPESRAELKALAGTECAAHPRFAFFGISDLTINSPSVQGFLEDQREILGIGEGGEIHWRTTRIRSAFIDYLAAPAAMKAKLLDKINLNTFTKSQVETFIKNHT
jgi:hypothetical protein